jgi:hypothetical protein
VFVRHLVPQEIQRVQNAAFDLSAVVVATFVSGAQRRESKAGRSNARDAANIVAAGESAVFYLTG